MANQMNMQVGAGIVTFLAVFAFFVAAICTLGGQQRALATRKFGDVSIDGELDLNGFRTKTYTQTYTNVPAVDAADSIGPIQGGFGVGHFIMSGSAQVVTANGNSGGNVILAVATPANAAVGQPPANVSSGTLLTATNAVGFGFVQDITGNSAFTANRTSLCTTIQNAVAQTGTMIVTATVMAVPGAPALP
jgi:hypothetical protein